MFPVKPFTAALMALTLLLAAPGLASAQWPAAPAGSTPTTTAPRTIANSGPAATIASSIAPFSFSSSESPSTFVCSLDGQDPTPCTSPQAITGLANGAHTFQAWAINASGQQDPTGVAWTFTVQAPAPQTLAVSGPSGTITTNSARFRFASSQHGSTFACSLDGAAAAPCTSTPTLGDLANGSHTFQAWAVGPSGIEDPAGVTWSFAVQVPAPQTIATGGPTPTITTDSARFHFTSNQHASTFVCSVDDQAPTPCTSPETITGLTNGQHTFHAWAIGPAGQQDPTGATWSFTVQTPPGVITPPSLNSYVARVGQTVTCSAGSWSGQPTISYRWYSDGTPVSASQTSGDYTAQRTDSGHALACQVRATNAAGTRQASAGAAQVEQFILLANLAFPATLPGGHALRTLPPLSFLSSNAGRVRIDLIASGTGRTVATKAYAFITGVNRLRLPRGWQYKLRAGPYRLILHARTPFGEQDATVALHVAGATTARTGVRRAAGTPAQLPAGASWGLSANQQAFAARLAQDTGLAAGVVAAWVASEEPASAARAPNGANNWLNIGCWDAGHWAGGGDGAWRTPAAGADATSAWLHGDALPGIGVAARGIQDILAAANSSPAAQIRAIQRSPWASSHYPELALTYRELQG